MDTHGQLVDFLRHMALLLRGHSDLLRSLHDIVEAGDRGAKGAGYAIGLLNSLMRTLGARLHGRDGLGGSLA